MSGIHCRFTIPSNLKMYSRQFIVIMVLILAVHVFQFSTSSRSKYSQPFYFRSLCADDQYQQTNSDGDTECHECSSCPPGHGVLRLCTLFNDTICQPCPRGSYSVSDSSSNSCLKCKECGPNQLTKTGCLSTKDRECKKTCTAGYYYNHFANRCYHCSYCYPSHGVSVRIQECQVEGVPTDYQCMIIGSRMPYADHQEWVFQDQRHEESFQTTNGLSTDESYTTTQRQYLPSTGLIHDQHYTTIQILQQTSAIIYLENKRTDNIRVIVSMVGVMIVLAVFFVVFYLHNCKHKNVCKSCFQGVKQVTYCLQIPTKDSEYNVDVATVAKDCCIPNDYMLPSKCPSYV